MTIEDFESHLRQTDSPRTVLAYMPDVRAFEAFRAGRPLDFDVYEAWVSSLSARPQTVWRKRAAVSRWMAFLSRHGDGGASRVLSVLQAGYKVARRARESDADPRGEVAEREYALVRDAAAPWAAALMDLLWWTGARVSEALGDGVSGIPHLTGPQGASLASVGHVETLGKGGKRRVLVLPAKGRQGLGGWVARQACASPGESSSGPLFPSPRDPSRPVSRQSFNEALHRAGLRCGAHAFRHSYKARLRRAGVRDEVIRALMGHGPSNVTERYGRVGLDEMVEGAEML